MAKIQLFIEYAKEKGRKLRYILNFLPFMMQTFDYLIFLNVIVLGYEALPSRLYFKTIVVELILCMVYTSKTLMPSSSYVVNLLPEIE